MHECLCDNFNTPGAMAALLSIVTDANSYVKDNPCVDALLLKKGRNNLRFCNALLNRRSTRNNKSQLRLGKRYTSSSTNAS